MRKWCCSSFCLPTWKMKDWKNSQNLFSRLAGYPVSDLTFLIYSSPPCLIIAWSPCRDADFLFNTADISQMLFCVDPLQCVMYNILMRWNGYSMFPSQTHSSNEKVCHLCLEDPSSSFSDAACLVVRRWSSHSIEEFTVHSISNPHTQLDAQK